MVLLMVCAVGQNKNAPVSVNETGAFVIVSCFAISTCDVDACWQPVFICFRRTTTTHQFYAAKIGDDNLFYAESLISHLKTCL